MEMDESELDEILNRDMATQFNKKYISVEGVTITERYLLAKEGIDNWEVSEDDVWICSFPRTGTTWTQEMVWMIMNNLDFVQGQVDLSKRSPYFEICLITQPRSIAIGESKFTAAIEDSLRYVKQRSEEGPVCIKTHLPWVLLPKQLRDGTKRPKIIYVSRNPKDTCVSYFHQNVLLGYSRASFDNFCRLFLAGKVLYGPFWGHVLPFWECRNQSNMLFIRYEDMIRDLPSVIRQVSNFLNKPLTVEQVTELAKHLSFESMKANPAVNKEEMVKFFRDHGMTQDKTGSFLRSGKVSAYKEEMTEELIKKFDEWTRLHTKDTDYFRN